jgi:hypothetical protein
LPETEDVLWDISKLNALQRKMQQMAFKFDSCMQQYSSRLADADTRITGCEVKIAEQLNRATSQLAATTTKHYNSLTTFVATSFEKFQSTLNGYTESILAAQRTKLMEMHTANKLKIQHDLREAERDFNNCVEQAIEHAIQEILSTADEATDNTNAQAEHLSQQAQPPQVNTWKNTVPRPSKLFPNVDVSQFASVSKSSTYYKNETKLQEQKNESDAEQPDHVTSFPIIGQFSVPQTDISQTMTSLPPVSHSDMLKRVHLPYPCREQSYIWYLQLKSNANQYGIYLIGTEDFRKNKSLCPTTVHGFKITMARYNDMKSTLYHFLAQLTIIGTEHTDLRNIVNRHAVSTDGYHVLHEIMQRIHPALDPDVLFTAPHCSDYSDIHEYYTYLTPFIMHEGFAGRHYNPREQVNHFLRGLDQSYHPAIKRIRNQMDSWKPSDPNVPDTLILANLPNNVEKYMEEDGKQAAIRRIGKGYNNRTKDTVGQTLKTDDLNRQYVDVKCPLCNTFGHRQPNCDRMAMWLMLKENSKLVDDKLRAKLFTNYAELDLKRRTKKLNKIKGTVRQLYQNGQFAEGENLLDSAMSLTAQSAPDTSTPSDSESSEDS